MFGLCTLLLLESLKNLKFRNTPGPQDFSNKIVGFLHKSEFEDYRKILYSLFIYKLIKLCNK